MHIFNKTLNLKANNFMDFLDITEDVKKIVAESQIKNGSVLVYSKHTTMAICVNEKEKGIVGDFKDVVTRLIPKDIYYRHNDLTIRTENLVCDPGASDCLNGHSHCIQLIMRNSETVPIIDGEMTLGTWQRIFAIELDCCRKRNVIVQVTGE